ncbi:MAG: hypothetical protein LUE27_06740 [Clostridia bacterium]|nr:hypothetical protein [Clostridia bacterium]
MRKSLMDVSRAKELLASYIDEETDIKCQKDRLDQLVTELYTIGSPELSAMPKSSFSNNDRVLNLIIKRDELAGDIDELERKHKEKGAYISVLADKLLSKEKTVIKMRYLDGRNWQSICFNIFGECADYVKKEGSYQRRTFRIHGRALCNMQKLMDENGQ